ncbi:hypothetical protein SAMN05428978_103314 [Nitrosomonas sp. Nm34]|nr:hypothetical protein SAMN05428978_103314 [Nitrosomonas sp. Nm34]
MKSFSLLSQSANFEHKILINRFKVTYHIRQSRSLYSACAKFVAESYKFILQKQKLLFRNRACSMLANQFFYSLDGHDKTKVRKLDCEIHMNDSTKEVERLEQPSSDRSGITKNAIFTSVEVRQQFIADCQNQFTELFVKFLCGRQLVDADGICCALRGKAS